MSDPKYLSNTVDGKLSELMEECSEVIKCGCKIQRFGWRNHHPDTPNKKNSAELFQEMLDLQKALERMMNCFGD